MWARALDNLLELAATREGGLADLIASMDFSYSADQISRALNQMSPEMYSGFVWAGLESAGIFADTISSRLEDVRMNEQPGSAQAANSPGEAASIPASADQWSFWAKGVGQKASRKGSAGGGMGFDQSLSGLAAGADSRLASWLRVGLAAGADRGDISWEQANHAGGMRSLHGGAYALGRWERWHARASLAYSRHQADAERSLNLASVNERADAEFDAHSGLIDLEGGYDYKLGSWLLGPGGRIALHPLRTGRFQRKRGRIF